MVFETDGRWVTTFYELKGKIFQYIFRSLAEKEKRTECQGIIVAGAAWA